MQTALEVKEILAGSTPLFFFDVELVNGARMRWCNRTIDWNGSHYEGRLVRTSLFEAQLTSETGIGGVPKLSFELANADSRLSQIESQTGFKGGKLTVAVAFLNITSGAAASDPYIVFRGIINSPERISESTLRLSAMNRMTMQRASLPDIRIQRMCPWQFPTTPAQRAEAVNGAARGRYSPLFRCGYSPDQINGTGNMNGGEVFQSCANTRVNCERRGMFSQDSEGRTTGRFGGFEFVPASILVRGSGQASTQVSALIDNQARYNDLVPLIYGTQWHSPDVVFSRNDGNLTRMEVLLGMGEIQGVVHVVVNGVEIPRGQAGSNMTGTGWYNVVSYGSKNGTRNADFSDGSGTALGDPYGSMAYLSVVVPNRISAGTSLAKVEVLTQGLKLYRFDANGNYLDESFSDNPAWVLLDILMRSGFTLDELSLASFAKAAAYAGEVITVADPVGGTSQLPRFQCNFALKDRRSAGEVIRGVRDGARLYLVMNAAGLIEVRVENTLALQQATKPLGSNSTAPFAGGWPAYEFDESSIARKSDGSSSVTIFSRSAQDTPNRYSIEFQDSLNQFQQDSLSLASGDDVALSGQEVAATLDAPGISTFSQAARMVLLALDRSIRGNRWITFDTSVKALGLSPGDLITVSYRKEGLARTPFRITKIAPGSSFRTATITAQIHDDEWYSDNTDVVGGALGRQPGRTGGLPAPVGGTFLDANGEAAAGLAETEFTGTDGAARIRIAVSYSAPPSRLGSIAAPILDVQPSIESGGTLAGETSYFYALSAVDSAGNEGLRSFLAQAYVPDGQTNSITLSGIQVPEGATSYHVYRGKDPRVLYRIASNVALGATFTDAGASVQAFVPPDPLFDHVNLYWRWELLPESQATASGSSSITHAGLRLAVDTHAGNVVRITRGTGERQERTILSNTEDTLVLSQPWTVVPDARSYFTIAESSWRMGCTGASSPLSFDVPERLGLGLHVCLRAATADDVESAIDVSLVTRWTLGQSGALLADADVPPLPVFAVNVLPKRPGVLNVSQISIPALRNTRDVKSATFRFYYFDEIDGTAFSTSIDLTASATSAALGVDFTIGTWLQMEDEILQVTALNTDGTFGLLRGALNSLAGAHPARSSCFILTERIIAVPFVRSFFGTPAAVAWSYLLDVPNVRLASATLVLTNAFGDSPVAVNTYTRDRDSGIRTLAGGQMSFQTSGYLAGQTGAAPDIVVDRDRSVGAIYANLREAPSGGGVTIRLNRNGVLYGLLDFEDGDMTSNSLDGFGLPTLRSGDRLSMDIASVGANNPGSDLTVVVSL